MKRSALAIIILAAIAALSACAPAGGVMGGAFGPDGPEEMPGPVDGVTDVGNPDSEADLEKGMYMNEEFDVAIEYPLDWTLDLDGIYEARFSSDEDESAIASFVWLEEGDSFDSFLAEVHGDVSDLVMMENTGFETFLCETTPPGDDGGMTLSLCYLHGIGERGEFVMVFSASLYGGIDDFNIVPMERHVLPEKFTVKEVKMPELQFDPSGIKKDRSFPARRSSSRWSRTSRH
jgi:hypothetical protein